MKSNYPVEINTPLLSHTPFILWAACFVKRWTSVQQLRKAAELTAFRQAGLLLGAVEEFLWFVDDKHLSHGGT